MEKKLKRRRKRNRDKDSDLVFADHYERIVLNKFPGKISCVSLSNKSFVSKTHENQAFVAISFSSNSIELYSLHYNTVKSVKTPSIFEIFSSITHEGHRSPARTLALSSNNHNLLTGSAESIKVWDVSSNKCSVHVQSSYCLCCCWFPGDKYIMVGCKTGEIQIFDILSSEKVINKLAHKGSI